jgi:hypothetical protein
MKQSPIIKNKKILYFITIFGVIILTSVLITIAGRATPFRIIKQYPATMLIEEADTMQKCGDCHEPNDFHTCDSCHDAHGSATLAGLSFNTTVHLTGDVPEEKFIPSNHVFLVGNQVVDQITINEFLKNFGIEKFQSITLYSNDGGFTTIASDQLGGTSLLLPYEDSIRFADENLHVSTWLKGISKIIVVGENKNLSIQGNKTSLGELLLQDTVQFTVEQAPVMLKNAKDGIVRTGYTAERMEGVDVSKLLMPLNEMDYAVILKDGSSINVKGSDLINSKLVLIGSDIVLVFPEKSRNSWIKPVFSIVEKS